jgi:AcrR family transcriptional regulator
MSPRRASYHHGDLRRALVDAALRMLAAGGPELTMRKLASSVGVDHTAVYRHFADKRALLAAVAEEGYRALAAAMGRAAARAGDEAVEVLGACCGAYVAFGLAHPAHFAVMAGPRINEDERFPELEAAIAATLAHLTTAIAAGQATGELRTGKPLDLALGLWSLTHGYAVAVAQRRIAVRSTRVAVSYFRRLAAPMLAGMAR